MQIKSQAFENNHPIPKKYTCDGEDISPPLTLTDIPPGTKTLALIVDDPDAPRGVFDHWIAWNIPGETTVLREGENVPRQGENHFGEMRYRGPCPPPGSTHHYRFNVYALDIQLQLPEGTSKAKLKEAMDKHILGQGQLVGTYKRGS